MSAFWLSMLCVAAASIEDDLRLAKDAIFAEPVMLRSDAGPLGHGLLYPSPAMYDLDGDGKNELILGDLRGSVLVAQKAGDADTHWGALAPVQSRHATPLKFSNW